MSGFDDGPLTGAPLSKPKTAQKGECCPPVILQTMSYGVADNVASVDLVIEGVFPEDSSGGMRETIFTTTLPMLSLAVRSAGAIGELDSYKFTFDTTAADGNFAVVVTGPCGCQDVAEVKILVL